MSKNPPYVNPLFQDISEVHSNYLPGVRGGEPFIHSARILKDFFGNHAIEIVGQAGRFRHFSMTLKNNPEFPVEGFDKVFILDIWAHQNPSNPDSWRCVANWRDGKWNKKPAHEIRALIHKLSYRLDRNDSVMKLLKELDETGEVNYPDMYSPTRSIIENFDPQERYHYVDPDVLSAIRFVADEKSDKAKKLLVGYQREAIQKKIDIEELQYGLINSRNAEALAIPMDYQVVDPEGEHPEFFVVVDKDGKLIAYKSKTTGQIFHPSHPSIPDELRLGSIRKILEKKRKMTEEDKEAALAQIRAVGEPIKPAKMEIFKVRDTTNTDMKLQISYGDHTLPEGTSVDEDGTINLNINLNTDSPKSAKKRLQAEIDKKAEIIAKNRAFKEYIIERELAAQAARKIINGTIQPGVAFVNEIVAKNKEE